MVYFPDAGPVRWLAGREKQVRVLRAAGAGGAGAPGGEPAGAGGCQATLKGHADPGLSDAGDCKGAPCFAGDRIWKMGDRGMGGWGTGRRTDGMEELVEGGKGQAGRGRERESPRASG